MRGGILIRKFIIGVMGGSQFVSPDDEQYAYQVGAMVAQEGWILLNGGRASGVMEASARGAKDNGGLTIGILPVDDAGWASRYIDIPIVTGIGMARNIINVLSSDIIIALPGSAGTISEIAMALKYNKIAILFRFDAGEWLRPFQKEEKVFFINEIEELRTFIKKKLEDISHNKKGCLW
ncbi:MAG: TIGR00725 family protein [Atribacterota bacterium]|nr:TIGR00725 family protein [Atribacterota bacterium]